MLNCFKPKTAEQMRASLLAEHQRRMLQAELAFEHAKSNLEMERAIVARLVNEQPN